MFFGHTWHKPFAWAGEWTLICFPARAFLNFGILKITVRLSGTMYGFLGCRLCRPPALLHTHSLHHRCDTDASPTLYYSSCHSSLCTTPRSFSSQSAGHWLYTVVYYQSCDMSCSCRALSLSCDASLVQCCMPWKQGIRNICSRVHFTLAKA